MIPAALSGRDKRVHVRVDEGSRTEDYEGKVLADGDNLLIEDAYLFGYDVRA